MELAGSCALAARHWVSVRVLNREMMLNVESVNKVDASMGISSIVGSLIHPAKGTFVVFFGF